MTDGASTPFRRLFEPLTIANFTVPSRVVSTPHSPRTPGGRELRYWEERAKAGVGLFGFATGMGVHGYDLGIGAKGQLGQWDAPAPSPLTPEGIAFYDDLEIPELRAKAELVHRYGARCFGQMAHSGASNAFLVGLSPLLGPSNVGTPIDGMIPHALSTEQVEELVLCFAHAIRRIAEAGMDAAEIHGAHGYMVSQFLSPYYNRRKDAWGGSAEKRVAFPLAIIAEARKMIGEFPIGIRMGYEGSGEGLGLSLDGLVENARLLAPHVCHISVSGGNSTGFFDGAQTSYFSSFYREPAYNAQAAAAVRRAVDVPVIVAGRIADPAIAEGLLADGTADMIGMVRGLIADPELLQKARRGEADRQRMCLGLSECRHEGKYKVHVTCAVNAAAGREDELAIVPAQAKGTVVVVGAGPAGMEAARVAALCGHKVYLCDRARELGGTVRIVANDHNRRNLRDHSAYFEAEFAALDIELVLGHEVNADDVLGFGADAVVIATGGQPIVPEIPGMDRANVVAVLDVLRGTATPGKRVLVVSGAHAHMSGPSIAEYLFDKGHEVQLISEQLEFASAIEDVARYTLQKRLHRKGVIPQLATRLLAVDDGGALLCDTLSEKQRRVEDVTVVLACGLAPDDRLYRELKGRVPALHLIGDALAPRRIMHATIEGARLGVSL